MSAMRVSLFLFLLFSPLFSQEEIAPSHSSIQILEASTAALEPIELIASAKEPNSKDSSEGYTINYNTLSILEYLRFASKICKVNFIYQEADLNFTVTIVSDEPVTPANVMATLVQVLRIHGLLLLEQDNNLVIHKSPEVKQMATLVTEDSPMGKSAIVTRIFRIKNAKPESVAAIIQPMISSSALLEVSSETRQLIITDISANVEKIGALIENLDSPHTLLVIKNYTAVNNSPDYLIHLASQIMNPIAFGNPFILVPQSLANEIFIVSTPDLTEKALEVFATLDTTPKVKPGISKNKMEDIFVYKVQYRSGENVLKGLSDIVSNLQSTDSSDLDLIKTIDTAKWIRETNSIMFIGTRASLDKTKEFLAALDVSGTGDVAYEKSSFFIYKPQYRSAEDVRQSILEMAENLQGSKGVDEPLLHTIQHSKVNPLTHTISFSGEEKTFPRVKELLATIDTPSSKSNALASTQFYIYKPNRQTGEDLAASVKEMTSQLKTDKLADPGLLNALGTMKWNKSTNSLLFTGDPESLKKVQTLVTSIDSTDVGPLERTFFQYHPKYADEAKTESYLRQVTQNLLKKAGTDSLIETLRTYKWIPDSQTFMFYGSRQDLEQVKTLLASFDTPDAGFTGKPGYFIYKVQNTTGDVIEEDLDSLAKNLKSSGVKDSGIVDVISKIKYVKQTNSLLLSGDPKAIEEVKQLIAQYDYSRTDNSVPASSNFFMYKPVHVPANTIDKSLKEIGANLKNAGLADPALLKALNGSKYVDTTNTLIFTGSPDTLQKIQGMIKDIDIAPTSHAPIQHVGKTTFLLYKLKNAGGTQIVGSLKNMSAELKKSGSADKDFVTALNSMKYIKETNSLFFTGNEEALKKVQGLVEQFDVTGLAGKSSVPQGSLTGPSNFFVYKPQSLPGPELEAVLQNFAENLSSSGLSDQDLFKTINSLRWSDKTQTLVFTGPQKTLDQIKDLLKQFDVPGADGKSIGSSLDSIQAIDNTSFLVYKLQFHKGEEIQNALRQIAKDLTLSNAPVNQGLLNSINSIQWLEVTNSILCSGDQETLTRLRELIKNLDIPLKQVFIEMLVIETTMSNALTFGLEWGANYKYRDKFGAGTYNSQPFTGATPDTWMQNLSGLTPPAPPLPSKIPVSSGFDLGVIGEVIRHNGQTFLTLGSLLSALQQDDETSVIMTPKILTQDGRTSTIFDGRNIPFVGSFVQNNSNTTVNTSNIEYRDIGFKLVVTPVLGNSDIVTLDIDLDRTQAAGDVTGAINFASSSAQGITTTKTTMQTTVHVPDNNFLILSGMVNNSNVKNKAGIPCLGGLPLIGAAFSKNGDTVVNTNIVIFIRPHIINSIDEMREITKREEDYFRDQAASPYLEKNFDDAMELIKTINDE